MDVKETKSPIRVTPKPKSCRKLQNVFYDNHGFPDQSDEFDHLLKNIEGGVILHKKKHPQPPLNVNNPTFNYKFDEALHAAKIISELLLDHLSLADATEVVALIKQYWTMFNKRGYLHPHSIV